MKKILPHKLHNRTIGTKLLLAFLTLSLASLLSPGYLGMHSLTSLGDYSRESSTSLGEKAANQSRTSLQKLGERMIEQKAKDVARQMEIYLTLNPNMTVSELQGDPEFRDIAVQPVGETGYTVALDVDSGTYYFHKYTDAFVNKTTKELFDDPESEYYNPTVWNLTERMLKTHTDFGGYYLWKEPVSGEMREKYVAFAVVNATTADGKQMFVAATTYISEFSRPADEAEQMIARDTEKSSNHIDSEIENTIGSFLVILVSMLAVVTVSAFLLSRKITIPITELTKGAEIIGKGNLDYRVEVGTGDELERLAGSFNRMASDLKLQMEQIEKTTREKEKIERELQIAHEIQKSFLPLKAPKIKGYQLAGLNLPAREVGGDFYDFIELDEDRLGIVIADVSGKGVPAALFMGISKTLVRANAKRIMDPVEALQTANSIILDESDSGMFVTLFYGILNFREHTFTYINAGHNPPLLLHRDNNEITLLKARGVPIGVMEDLKLESKTVSIKENELLFLYTDGVTEAVNEGDEEFGVERLYGLLEQEENTPPDIIIEKMVREIRKFAGNREQFDDITMVVLQSQPETQNKTQPHPPSKRPSQTQSKTQAKTQPLPLSQIPSQTQPKTQAKTQPLPLSQIPSQTQPEKEGESGE